MAGTGADNGPRSAGERKMADQTDQTLEERSEAAPQEIDETEQLRERLAEAEKQASEHRDQYLRSRAEMENYKKRLQRNYSDQAQTAKKELLKKLLGVEDNLERALQYGESGQAGGESLLEGVRLTKYQLDQLLEQEGVHRMEAQGKAFDPHTEEAVHRVHEANVPDHQVVQVVRPGYTYGDQLLRPAQVVVNVHGDNE